MVTLSNSSKSFVTTQPEWTLNGALLTHGEEAVARVAQGPFLWIEGAWEADVSILPVEVPEGMESIRLNVRVTPDTLRRWRDVGINPFIEARAQLKIHWQSAKAGRVDTLTLL